MFQIETQRINDLYCKKLIRCRNLLNGVIFEIDLSNNKNWEPWNTFVLFEVLAEGINRHLLQWGFSLHLLKKSTSQTQVCGLPRQLVPHITGVSLELSDILRFKKCSFILATIPCLCCSYAVCLRTGWQGRNTALWIAVLMKYHVTEGNTERHFLHGDVWEEHQAQFNDSSVYFS